MPQLTADQQVDPIECLLFRARASLARLQQKALALARSTMVAAGVAALCVCAAAVGLLNGLLPEPSVATWHELALNARSSQLIIDERADTSRPFTRDRDAAITTAEGTAIRAASIKTEAAASSRGSADGLPKMLANSVASAEPAVINAVASDKQIKKTIRPKTVKLAQADPREPAQADPREPAQADPREPAQADPREACRDRNFMSAAVCMNRRCDEPLYKNHPQCATLQRGEVIRRDRY